jgi:hypothetical protein
MFSLALNVGEMLEIYSNFYLIKVSKHILDLYFWTSGLYHKRFTVVINSASVSVTVIVSHFL